MAAATSASLSDDLARLIHSNFTFVAAKMFLAAKGRWKLVRCKPD
jgi:hypothetical protein